MHGNGEIIISTEMKSQVKRDSFLYNHIVKESITYNGEWKNGLFDGNGKWEKQQITYEKEVKDFSNNIISISNLTYTYDGEWKNGVKQGYGDYKEYKETMDNITNITHKPFYEITAEAYRDNNHIIENATALLKMKKNII